ncbi:MAG: sodium-dependent transporter [Eubacteriales bacterium]|nr:sodium-dependent transporter [Eubacteriales bacterium]
MAETKREDWTSRFGAIMSMAGMAVGLGNVWRFPYLVGQYGGGAFVFAYLISLIVCVIPLCLVEASLGKGMQAGELDTWTKITHSSKVGKTIGSIFSLGYSTMNFYFMFVLAGSIYFMYTFATNKKATMAPEKIYQDMNDNHLTALVVITILVTLLTFFVLWKGIVSGIESISKVMMPAIVVIFAIIIIFCAILTPNIVDGYNFYLEPDWSVLKHLSVWKAAAGQAFFSIGVGPGCVLVYGSHIKRNEDVTMSMITVCMVDTTIALLAGFAIIPTCVALGIDPQSGSGLIFIVLPKALSQIPFGNVFGILAMLAIFFAGITSAIAQAEVAITSFSDGLKMNRNKVTFSLCLLTLVFAVICAVNTSQFDFWNNFSGNYVFIVSAGIGAIGFNYVYGTKKIRTEFMNPGSDIQIGGWFDKWVQFVACPIALIITADSLYPFLP